MQNHIFKVQIQKKKAFTRSWAGAASPERRHLSTKNGYFVPVIASLNFTAGKIGAPKVDLQTHNMHPPSHVRPCVKGSSSVAGSTFFWVVQSLAFLKSKVAGKIQNLYLKSLYSM